MKKNHIFGSLLLGACMVGLTGCDDNDWNDQLDGFEGNPGISDVRTIEYTLTDADYASIASNAANKALAGDANADALKAVGTQMNFTDVITAKDYVPAFLSSTAFPYFTLDNGSAVKVTYRVATGQPEEVTASANAEQYKVTENDYKTVWGSEQDYVNAFSPSQSASKNLPSILKAAYPDAEAGSYAIVTYSEAAQDPVFDTQQGGGEEEPFAMTDVIKTVVKGETYEIQGVVTGISANGYVLTDKGGSIFVYVGNSFDASTMAIGNQVKLTGEVDAYNKGLQVKGSSATVAVMGSQAYTYPTAKVFDGAALDEAITRADDALAVYCTLTGVVSISGNYINVKVDGAANANASIYYATDDMKAKLVNGETVTVSGYFIAIAGKRNVNIIATEVATGAKAAMKTAKAVAVSSVEKYAVYYFDGTKWSVPTDFAILNPSDYAEMGQKYGNLTEPGKYLPTYLGKSYPYAQAEDAKFVLYKYYSGGATSYRCDRYKYDGTQWVLNDGVVEETAQFVRNNGKWAYDPSVVITLPAGKGQELSTKYFQACTDWVFENIDKKLGSTSITSGMGYVTSYGNNEYYAGTSAYQGNLDLRAAKAKEQYPDGYKDLSDDEIVKLMKKHFCEEVMPGALSMLNGDAAPVDGIDVTYTVNFSVYDGKSTTAHTLRFLVTGKGQFKCFEEDQAAWIGE